MDRYFSPSIVYFLTSGNASITQYPVLWSTVVTIPTCCSTATSWGQMLFCLGKVTRVTHTSRLASFSDPAQLSVTFSMVKLGEPGIFSPEYDVHVVRKWWKFAELTGCVSGIFNQLHAQCSVRQSPPASYVHVVSYLVLWLFLLFWAKCVHA